MGAFLKYFFAAFLAIVAFIFFFFLVILLSASMSGSSPVTTVKDNSILHLTFDNPIVDKQSESNFKFEIEGFQTNNNDGLNRILKQIAKAKVDPQIQGIYMDTREVMTGSASLQEIREAMLDFKESGKWILTYSDMLTQRAYYLASAGDEVYLQPEGALEVVGLSANVAFLRDALDQAGVEMQVIRPKNNRFKSAVEPFLLDSMSAANEEQVSKFLGSIWDKMAVDMSTSRGMTVEQFNEKVNSFASHSIEKATEAGLIDGGKYEDEIMAMLRERTSIDADKDLRLLSIQEYSSAIVDGFKDTDKGYKKEKIAVIYASGEIGMGEGGTEDIGTDLALQLREARSDSSVKAIVLRVNSPGGSALTSDIIWRETVLAKETKPLIVSMGNVAASGGYYIACEADKIFANENTITGSIGVFGTIPNATELMEEKLEVHFDGVKTHRYADMFEMNRPMRADERAIIQNSVDDIYIDFTTKVAEGRGLTQAYVDSIGQGRVWSGVDAKEIGLIDEFGGLSESIAAAAEMADLTDYAIKNLPKDKDPFEELMKDLGGTTRAFVLESFLTSDEISAIAKAQKIRSVLQTKGIQMHMPYMVEID